MLKKFVWMGCKYNREVLVFVKDWEDKEIVCMEYLVFDVFIKMVLEGNFLVIVLYVDKLNLEVM